MTNTIHIGNSTDCHHIERSAISINVICRGTRVIYLHSEVDGVENPSRGIIVDIDSRLVGFLSKPMGRYWEIEHII